MSPPGNLTAAAVTAPAEGTLPGRVSALRAVEDLLAHDAGPVLRVLTEVTTYRAAQYELAAARATLAGAVAELDTYRPAPVARLAAFLPSNVLLYSYVLYLLVPSLFTERLWFRPASGVRRQVLALHDLLAPVHRLPATAMPVSQRAFLAEAVAPADVVVFTGAYQNAELLRPELRPEQLFLYLGGGPNPFVVTPGADLDRAARDAVTIRLFNSGQDCLAPDLFIVQEELLDDFVTSLVHRLAGLRYGRPDDPDADYGPIIHPEALERAAIHLHRHRHRIVYGGQVDFRRRRLDPTVLILDEHDSKLGRTEVFAPIFNLLRYRDQDTLIRTLTGGALAERAMGASVYGPAPRLVSTLAERHMVTTDQTLLALDDGNKPFGGRGPMANHIAHLGRVYAEPVLVSKAVAEHLTGTGRGDRR